MSGNYYITKIEGLRFFGGEFQSTPVGKTFKRDENGGVTKQAIANTPYRAQTIYCPCLGTLAGVLSQLSGSEALVLGFLPGTERLDEYLLLSSSDLKELRGLDEKAPQPLELFQLRDGRYVAGRFKESFQNSPFFLLDRDYDPYLPPSLADASYDEWWARMTRFFPMLAGAGRVVAPSSKSRLVDGAGRQIFDTSSSHTYCQLKDPSDFYRFTESLKNAALDGDLGYDKPSSHQKVNADGIKEDHPHTLRRSIFDCAVFNSNRIDFAGAPAVAPDSDLYVLPAKVTVYPGTMVDSYLMPVVVRTAPRTRFGAPGSCSRDNGSHTSLGGVQHLEGLSLNTLIETARYGDMTVLELWNAGYLDDGQKIRCQTPFRPDSRSWNGILRLTQEGIIHLGGSTDGLRVLRGLPCLHDNGIATTFHLDAVDACFGSAAACSPEVMADTLAEQKAAEGRPPVLLPLHPIPKAAAEVGHGSAPRHMGKQCEFGSSRSWFDGIHYK